MTFVDDQGRLFGRWNIVDALIGVVLIGLIPLLYGAYVLFKPSRPSLTAIEPARILSGTDLDLKVRGTNLRPYMRVSVGTHQGNRFLFVDETEAVVPMDALPPGVYDVILYDHAQERARIPKGFEVVATPKAESQLDVIGSFTGSRRSRGGIDHGRHDGRGRRPGRPGRIPGAVGDASDAGPGPDSRRAFHGPVQRPGDHPRHVRAGAARRVGVVHGRRAAVDGRHRAARRGPDRQPDVSDRSGAPRRPSSSRSPPACGSPAIARRWN